MLENFEFGSNAWLIAYDIAEPKRLGRVHRLLKKVAVPVQYSVFLAWLNEHQLANLVEQIHARIDDTEDDVRVYHLPRTTQLATLGKSWLPQGVLLLRGGCPIQLRFEFEHRADEMG